jgi:AcrR family transcriptional regulator
MTTNDDDLTIEAILETLEAAHAGEEPVVVAGLRERKKHRARQRISNVATALFLAEGFDNVTVARIAEASEVSEQTVFNYFPTKESMFFDRSESNVEALADAVRHRGSEPLGDVVVDTLFGGIPLDRWDGMDEAHSLRLFRRFCEVAESSPTLRAAPYVELERFTATVGASLAERIGRDAGDPEVELAAIVIAGLARVWALATYTQVQRVSSLAALERAVRSDVTRAAHLAAPTLDAFDNLDSRTLNGAGGDTIPVLPASDAAQLGRSPSPASAADHVGEQPPG